jgi:hypothetical protein
MSTPTETILLRVLLPVSVQVLSLLADAFPEGTLVRDTGGVLEFFTVEKEVGK